MKDITIAIKTTMSQNVLWDVDVFYKCIEIIEKGKYQISYWQGEENWATILYNDKGVGYIWKKYPLLFIISEHAKNIKTCLKEFVFITVIDVTSLDSKEFQIKYDDFKDHLDFGIDQKCFSAEDLWFYTNSL